MRWLNLILFVIGYSPVGYTQTTDPNVLSDLDDFTILRNMVSKTFDERENNLKYEYKLHKTKVGLIQYWVDRNGFEARSNLDIYNRILYADFDRDGIILPHQFDSKRIDSLYLHFPNSTSPSIKFIYNPKLDLYAEVLNEGNYIIAEAFDFQFQKRNINPVLDGGSFDDKIILKKIPYLIDTGHWYRIPKNKNDFIKFAFSHYRRKLTKSHLKGSSTLDFVLTLN